MILHARSYSLEIKSVSVWPPGQKNKLHNKIQLLCSMSDRPMMKDKWERLQSRSWSAMLAVSHTGFNLVSLATWRCRWLGKRTWKQLWKWDEERKNMYIVYLYLEHSAKKWWAMSFHRQGFFSQYKLNSLSNELCTYLLISVWCCRLARAFHILNLFSLPKRIYQSSVWEVHSVFYRSSKTWYRAYIRFFRVSGLLLTQRSTVFIL